MRFLPYLLIINFFIGCSSDSNDDFVYALDPLKPQEYYTNNFSLKDLDFSNEIDILFVIDNSGSMSSIQRNVERNAELFFREFAKKSLVRWKLGIVTTDNSLEPVLGFDDSFDHTLINPNDPSTFDNAVEVFQNAVDSIGTSGSPTEESFSNVERHLDDYINKGKPFLRSSAHFVVIYVTDEREQSGDGIYTPINFYERTKKRLRRDRVFLNFAALGFNDLQDCKWSSISRDYEGSRFQEIVELSGGFHISACTDDFGTDLARIGESIKSLVVLPSLLLTNVPLVDTIEVFYENQRLKPGRPQSGGVWFYQEKYNAIFFHTLDFVQNFQTDSITVEFDIQDGIDRDQPGPIGQR